MTRLITSLLLILSSLTALCRDYTPEEIPNVNIADRTQYVSDPGGLLSPAAKNRANAMLDRLRRDVTAEVAVAIVPSIGDLPIEDFAEKLFTSWGLGKEDKDNGVLLIIAPEQRQVRIQTGYGAEGVLPDIECARIISDAVVPHMRQGDLDGAVTDAVSQIATVMSDPEAAAELRSKNADPYARKENGGVSLSRTLPYIFSFVFIITLIIFLSEWHGIRRCGSEHQKALKWRSSIKLLSVMAVLSGFTGIIFPILAWIFYRRLRTHSHKCYQCGAKMKRLSEKEDNAYLDNAQDLEERLNTVDYDVWRCPVCGETERIPYKVDQSRYTTCPACHTVALGLACDREIRPATTRSEGYGEKIYECKYCGHNDKKPYVIPKKEDLALAAAALGAAAASSRRGGFGGGGFGGGFGGGSTGGGGASGGW